MLFICCWNVVVNCFWIIDVQLLIKHYADVMWQETVVYCCWLSNLTGTEYWTQHLFTWIWISFHVFLKYTLSAWFLYYIRAKHFCIPNVYSFKNPFQRVQISNRYRIPSYELWLHFFATLLIKMVCYNMGSHCHLCSHCCTSYFSNYQVLDFVYSYMICGNLFYILL